MASLRELATLFETRIKTRKVHRVLEFDQSQWLKPYVEFNTKKNRFRKKMMTRMERH